MGRYVFYDLIDAYEKNGQKKFLSFCWNQK